jgi:hypothetical protein
VLVGTLAALTGCDTTTGTDGSPAKPGSKPYLSPNMPKAPPDPDAERKIKAFFNRMRPNHPLLQDDD